MNKAKVAAVRARKANARRRRSGTNAMRGNGASGATLDITELKKAERELKKSKEMLEKLVQQRTRALRVANTELQTEISRRK
jgi:hypothetical protein